MSAIKVITREAYDRLAEQCGALQAKLARREALLQRWLTAGNQGIVKIYWETLKADTARELSGQNEKEAG